MCNKKVSDLEKSDYRIIFQLVDIGVVSKKSVSCQRISLSCQRFLAKNFKKIFFFNLQKLPVCSFEGVS